MSSMGKIPVSDLPEDIEQRIAAIHKNISLLERKKIDLEASIAEKTTEESLLIGRIVAAKEELKSVIDSQSEKISSLKDREEKISQKESALDVYANALKEKEDRIMKYIAIFENVKKVIGS